MSQRIMITELQSTSESDPIGSIMFNVPAGWKLHEVRGIDYGESSVTMAVVLVQDDDSDSRGRGRTSQFPLG